MTSPAKYSKQVVGALAGVSCVGIILGFQVTESNKKDPEPIPTITADPVIITIEAPPPQEAQPAQQETVIIQAPVNGTTGGS